MNYDAIELILRKMGSNKIKLRNLEVIAPCPFARFDHVNGEDRHPSFGINMAFEVYNCFTCKRKGTIKQMIYDYCELSGDNPREYLKLLDKGIRNYYIDVKRIEEEKEEPQMTAEEVSNYLEYKGRYHSFLESKGILPYSVHIWGLASTPTQIVFPVLNKNKKICGFIYRNLLAEFDSSIPKYSFTKGLKKSNKLYGSDKVKLNKGPLVIVEGILDTIYLHQLDINVVGVYGTHISDEQIRLIKSISPSKIICILFDDDEAGRLGIEEAERDLGKWFNVVGRLSNDIRNQSFESINDLFGGVLCKRDQLVVF
jgi:DNA primase